MRHQLIRGLAMSLLVVLAVLPGAVQAQSSEGLELKPAVIEDNAAPSQQYRFTVHVTNIASSERTFYLSAKDIKGLDDEGLPVFATEGEATEYSLSSWVQLPQSAITLKAGETKDVPFTVNVPSSASPGAHFGGVFLSAEAPRLSASGAAIGISVGTIINLKIAGDVVEDAQLREFSTDKLVYGMPAVTFSAKVSNRGNVLVRPHGLVEVSDMFGKKVGTLTVNDNAAPVFPGTDRAFATSWDGEGFAFGRYQAVVSLVYGDEARKTISGATSFWVLPLKPILTTIGILLAFIVLLYLSVRSYIRRTLRSMGATPGRMADHVVARRGRAASRMMIVALAVFVFALAFLGLLFFIFA